MHMQNPNAIVADALSPANDTNPQYAVNDPSLITYPARRIAPNLRDFVGLLVGEHRFVEQRRV